MGRSDRRLLVGALCGISLTLAAALVLGQPRGSLAVWSAELAHRWPHLRHLRMLPACGVYRSGVSILSSVLVPGVVAASVTALLYWWIQRPRADLDLVRINQTVEVAKWLARAEKDPDADDAMKDANARVIVLLTNYGDGPAYDIRLKGANCRAHVWVRDVGETEDAEVVAGVPMWNDRLRALGPGEMMSVVVTSSPDKDAFSTHARSVEVSWPRLPRRGFGRIKRGPYDLATARTLETGWPG